MFVNNEMANIMTRDVDSQFYIFFALDFISFSAKNGIDDEQNLLLLQSKQEIATTIVAKGMSKWPYRTIWIFTKKKIKMTNKHNEMKHM